jgi:hypothetical protein
MQLTLSSIEDAMRGPRMIRRAMVRMAQVASVCLGMTAGALSAHAQGIGLAPETGKLRLAVMELNGSARRIQQTHGQMPQGGGVQATQTVSLPPPPEFARTLTEMLTTALLMTGRCACAPGVWTSWSSQRSIALRTRDSSGRRGTGFAGPLAAPPWRGAPKALRGGVTSTRAAGRR